LRKGFLNLLTEDDTLAAERVLPAAKVTKGQVPAVAASGSGELPQE
jgi:hypothetical protein